jgi:DNA-binding LacI/PurR family transcriptional regulator
VWKAPVDLIHHDRLAACKEVADHFAAAGRRRPVIMGSSMANNEKVRAFMERASMNSMSVGPDSLIEVQYLSHNQTVKACQWTLKERYGKDKAIDFDALFCMSDEGAMASIDWLRKRGVRVPQDVAVIGFNDNEIDDCMDPPLASVERNDDQVADVIDEILFTRLIHPELPPQRRYVSMRFVWRESAGRRRDTG